MDVDEKPDVPDGSMLLLIHHVVNDSEHQFGQNLQHELLLEISSGVGHDHRQRFGQELEEFLLVITLPEVDWQPVRQPLVCGRKAHRLFQESFNGNIIEKCLRFPNIACPGDFTHPEPQSQLIFLIG